MYEDEFRMQLQRLIPRRTVGLSTAPALRATSQGKRMNRFINDAIDAQMKSGTGKE